MIETIQLNLEESIENTLNILKLLEHLKKSGEPPVYTFANNGTLYFKAVNMDQLHEVRKYLRDALGQWQDAYQMTWVSGMDVLKSYRSEIYKDIEIWVSIHKDALPDNYFGSSCKLVECKTKEYNIVCEQVNDR